MTPSDWYDAACRQMADQILGWLEEAKAAPPGEFDESKCGGRPMITLDEKDTLVTALSAKMDADIATMLKTVDAHIAAMFEEESMFQLFQEVPPAGEFRGTRDFRDFCRNVRESASQREHIGFMHYEGNADYWTFYDTADVLRGPYRNTPEDVARAVKETK